MAEDEKEKQPDIKRKRAEVRKRMEEALKTKKGFLTPKRSQKLRLLLRKKFYEAYLKEKERKIDERRRIIEERCGKPKNIEDANEASLKTICQDYHSLISLLEMAKIDLEYEVARKDSEIAVINEGTVLNNKLVKPMLKHHRKFEKKFTKVQKNPGEFNFRDRLKVVKKKEFTLEEEKLKKKPDWSKAKDTKVKEEHQEVEAEA